MAITIDWENKIINVPKSDLTLIQASPTEIRELDINWFRLELRSLEASNNGMPYERTHRHFTEVTLGGLTFARVVEIINNYTVTFEDGQYAVNLTGANNNVGDVVNVNQVSVRSSNSAGLISTPLIEYSSFEGGVSVDTVNGVSGTLFPTGTKQRPVNNLSDAKLIADYRGFKRLFISNHVVIDSGIDYDSFIIEGSTQVHDSVDISDAAGAYNTVFNNLDVQGILDGDNELINCKIHDLEYVNGFIRNCGMTGTTTLGGNSLSTFSNCYSVSMENNPIIDMGSSGQDCSVPNYSGVVTIKNLTGDNFCGIGLTSGRVFLDPLSITSGTIYVSGTGRLLDATDNSQISSGIWNGGVTVINELSSPENISSEVWGSATLVEDIAKLTGNRVTKSGDIITIYEDDETTVWRQYDLTGGGREQI